MSAAASSPYLAAAVGAARWIRANAYETAHGIAWRPEPDHLHKMTTISSPPSLYSGNAGIVLFFLELADATGDTAYLDDARRGGDELAANWRAALDFPSFIPVENIGLDFQFGAGGAAFTLVHLWKTFNDERYRAAAEAIGDEIAARAQPADAGIEWIGQPTLGMGDGGIVLTLIWLARALDRPDFRELAILAGRRLLEQAEPDPRGGLRWRSRLLEQLGAPAGAYAPNFELGTAGVAYVLASLFEETGDRAFLDAALSGAEHVRALATVDREHDSALLFYREPDLTDLYYLGYCHGPVGTSRLFYKLYKISGDDQHLDWTHKFARGIATSGFPDQPTPGLWNVVCQCCGTAGVFDYFTSLWVATGAPEDLTFAERVADETLRRQSDTDGKGTRWYQAWTRVKPDDVAAETGYMIGAAGVGSAFLHLHLAKQGAYRAILFPDNPFPQEIVPV